MRCFRLIDIAALSYLGRAGVLVVAAVISTLALPVVSAEEGAGAQGQVESKGAEHADTKRKPKLALKQALGADTRGQHELTVCSQNLKLLGTFAATKQKNIKYTERQHEEKIEDLVQRFLSVKCDVIGVQEVLGVNTAAAEAALQPLVDRLRKVANRTYQIRVSPPAEGGMTLGFLVAEDRAIIGSTLSYARIELPKLVAKQRPRPFLRAPLEVQLLVQSKSGEVTKTVSIVNFHLKSKRGGQGDPTGLEWETYRMEMAEAMRRIVEVRHQKAFASSESILLLLGDRNSNFDVASARILEGSLTLANFQNAGGCRLSKRGVPICQVGEENPKRLFSVLTSNQSVQSLPGTFVYKGEFSWLDDILMPSESLSYAWQSSTSEGRYESGVVYEPKQASDHAMIWVKLNWGTE